jgi:hypothetical protein
VSATAVNCYVPRVCAVLRVGREWPCSSVVPWRELTHSLGCWLLTAAAAGILVVIAVTSLIPAGESAHLWFVYC